jgi:hypothetical protein
VTLITYTVPVIRLLLVLHQTNYRHWAFTFIVPSKKWIKLNPLWLKIVHCGYVCTFQEINKTAYYELDPGVPSLILSTVNSVTKVVFRAWIPFYNPPIEVTLNYGNGSSSNTTWASYLRVLKVGKHFEPVS